MFEVINLFIGGSTVVSSIEYASFADKLGELINGRDYRITFDGCNGYPRIVYEHLDDKTRARVIYNDWYKRPNVECDVTQLAAQSTVCDTFIKSADALIFLRGGMGTLTEIMRAIDGKKNGEHDKPIVIINLNHEWDSLEKLLEETNVSKCYYISDNVENCLEYIENELYKKGSSFLNKYQDYLQRKGPIIIKKKRDLI